jgi:hypothetical protein
LALEKGCSYGQKGKPNTTPKSVQSSSPERGPQRNDIVADLAKADRSPSVPKSAQTAAPELTAEALEKGRVEGGKMHASSAPKTVPSKSRGSGPQRNDIVADAS